MMWLNIAEKTLVITRSGAIQRTAYRFLLVVCNIIVFEIRYTATRVYFFEMAVKTRNVQSYWLESHASGRLRHLLRATVSCDLRQLSDLDRPFDLNVLVLLQLVAAMDYICTNIGVDSSSSFSCENTCITMNTRSQRLFTSEWPTLTE